MLDLSNIKLTPKEMGMIADNIMRTRPHDEIRAAIEATGYQHQLYKTDPVGFGEQVLGLTYTDDIKAVMRSVAANPVTLVRSCNAPGKSLPIETPVLTPEGFKPIRSLDVGDQVMGNNGKPVKITGVYPQGLQPTCRVHFNDETSFLCSEDHLWTAISSSDKSAGLAWKIYDTKTLTKSIYRHMHIPMCAPVCFNPKNLLVDPYVMGILIGDGCLGQGVRFTTADDWIVEEVSARTPGINVKKYKKMAYGITTPHNQPNPAYDALVQYKLIGVGAKDKYIPEDYMWGSVEQRKALLAGLMDSDGYIDITHSMAFTTISQKLAEQVRVLVWSLGGTAKTRSKLPIYTHNGERRIGQKAYTLYIKVPFCPFKLPRKIERYIPENELQKQAQRIIKKIEFVGEMDSVCIKIDADNGLFIAENYTVTHNSHCAASLAIWFYLAYGPDCRVYTAAAPPEDNLRRILWGEIAKQLDKASSNPLGSHIRKDLHIKRSDHSFLTGLTIPTSGTEAIREAKFSGKHSPNMLWIFDEGDAIPDECYRGQESCASGGFVRMLILFNPRSQIGHVHRLEQQQQANVISLSAFNHPNVITGDNVIPGAVTREATVRRINEWCRPLVEGEPERDVFELPEYLVGAIATSLSGVQYLPLQPGKYTIIQPAFSYMVLGRYPAQGSNQLISRDWIRAARQRWDVYVSERGEVPPATLGVMGIDVAEMGDDANVVCFRYGAYVSKVTTWGGVDTIATGDRAALEYYDRDVLQANVDATGVGAGVAPQMRRKDCNAHGIKVASRPTKDTEIGEFRILRDQLWWECREWLRTDPGAMLPPDEDLTEELATPTYMVVNGKIEVMKKDIMRELLKRSPDRADALCMTFADTDTVFDPLDLGRCAV